ncbi:hypothetical protein ABZV58_30920 [Nocardia sp. NPDC004654]|uniref:hypothetical protein n=1 Tax=Nocardia sp. NPDC004654 TaxID=3154776 RepID=UPI0033B53D87
MSGPRRKVELIALHACVDTSSLSLPGGGWVRRPRVGGGLLGSTGNALLHSVDVPLIVVRDR